MKLLFWPCHVTFFWIKDSSFFIQEALQSIATDPGLYQMLPRFSTFISEGVSIFSNFPLHFEAWLTWVPNIQVYLCSTHWLYVLLKGSCECGAKQLGSTDLPHADGQSANGQPHPVLGEICEWRKKKEIWWLNYIRTLNYIINTYFLIDIFFSAFL